LAVMMKVPVRKLEALEADRFEELLDMVFTRALAASVSRVLKIDPIPVLAALPKFEATSIKTDQESLNTPLQTNRFEWIQQLKNRLASPLGLGVALMVLAVLVIVNWPDQQAAGDASATLAPVPQTGADPVPTPALPASNPATAGTVLDEVPLVIPQALSSPASATVPEASAPAVSAAGILVLQSRQQSWVEVTDAGGVLQLRKTLAAGEAVQLSGALPLSVVLGRADVVDVMVRGERLDVTAMTQNNVARFEVK
ncbi:MAG TPA: RodZ domain-containing protein, partial [Rhodoferax sp.]|nr:RodZ domain-containing protein [Rhodoferax sp.]